VLVLHITWYGKNKKSALLVSKFLLALNPNLLGDRTSGNVIYPVRPFSLGYM